MERRVNARSLTSICIAMCIATAAAPRAHGQNVVRLVDKTAQGPGHDGLTWPTAYRDLQDALDEASNPAFGITQIWVAAGQYKPTNPADPDDRAATYTLVDGVAVYGGFAGTESDLSDRDTVANDTRLVGSFDNGPSNNNGLDDDFRRYHVVTAIDVQPPTRLDGFLIENAQADAIGGNENVGGGVLVQNSNPLIIRCTFWHNKASDKGGAIYFEPPPSNPVFEIINSVFIDNLGDDQRSGGAMYNVAGRPAFTNCSFTGNKVVGNGGAIYNDDGTPTFINCTFAGNHSGDAAGGGIFSTGVSGHATLTNCILWENVAEFGTVGEQQITGSATVTYCCIQVGPGEPVYPGEGNIRVNPLLRGSPSWGTLDDDTRLLPGSPCIDTGNPDESLIPDDGFDIDNDGIFAEKTPDLDLEQRIVDADGVPGAVVDMGAYEFFACVGDVDDSGAVDILDFLALLADWGPCPAPCPPLCAADLDGDCTVGIVDFLALLADWGCGDPGSEPFPESAQECIDRYWPDVGKVSTCITALGLME
ncbi:MAG: right-handed parallel beta-helix repeat-containing protein [Planctomycetes bacterium]|nr:right-handed parallel beta-helix repeat-containing protein [Planctomycetota bacterium]